MTRPVRVTHVVATTGVSGVESHLLALLASFDPASVSARLIVPGPGPLVDAMRARGITVDLGAPTRKLDLAAARALTGLLREGADLVHAHGPRAAFWAAWAAAQARRPLIVTVHELRWRSLPPGARRVAWVALERAALSLARRVVCVSQAQKRALVARWPSLQPRVRVVHGSTPWLLAPDQMPRASPATAAQGARRLIAVGRLAWAKGHDRALRALALARRLGAVWTLEIVGEGEERSALTALTERLGLRDVVHFAGSRAGVDERLARAHAFLSGSRTETFGVAVLEAMAAGLPVVAPAVDALPELIEDGHTGLLVPDGRDADVEAGLAAALVRLAESPALGATLGAAGADVARSRFAPSALAAGVSAVYRECVAIGLDS